MRFQRHAKIFRGQLDPAPVAGVFFLLIIFVILGFLLYTPGVIVELKDGQVATGATITITREGTIVFAGITNHADQLEQLRTEIKNFPGAEPLELKMEPGAPTQLRDRVHELLAIDPPEMTEGLVGTDNPVVIVAVNLRGQFFYENHMVQEQELKSLLRERLKAASQISKDLTLVLLQDKAVPAKTFVRLCSLAKEVGIKEVMIATRPGTFSKTKVPHAQ